MALAQLRSFGILGGICCAEVLGATLATPETTAAAPDRPRGWLSAGRSRPHAVTRAAAAPRRRLPRRSSSRCAD